MKFEIIKISEANTNWNETDREFKGQTKWLNGWNFEAKDENGGIHFFACVYSYDMPEDYYTGFNAEYMDEVMWRNGWKLTGRVIFRGYYREYYWEEERDWCVEEVEVA